MSQAAQFNLNTDFLNELKSLSLQPTTSVSSDVIISGASQNAISTLAINLVSSGLNPLPADPINGSSQSSVQTEKEHLIGPGIRPVINIIPSPGGIILIKPIVPTKPLIQNNGFNSSIPTPKVSTMHISSSTTSVHNSDMKTFNGVSSSIQIQLSTVKIPTSGFYQIPVVHLGTVPTLGTIPLANTWNFINSTSIVPFDMSRKKEIELVDDQPEHMEKMNDILKWYHVVFDRSGLGSGKTYTGSSLAKTGKYKYVVLISPPGVESKWEMMRDFYGVPIVRISSWQGLASKKNFQPSHGLLSRYDDPESKTPAFTRTSLLLDIIREGCLFIFDEIQNIKNANTYWRATGEIVSAVLDNPGKSRVLAISGSMADKEECIINIMKCFGIIRHTRLFTFHEQTGKLHLIGAKDVVELSNKINSESTKNLLNEHPFTKYSCQNVCYRLFCNVILPSISACMKSPKIPIDLANGYYLLETEEQITALTSAINDLHRSTRFNEKNGVVDFKKESMGAITKALHARSMAKIPIFIRVAKMWLDADPTNKVVCMSEYIIPIQRISKALADYGMVCITGKVNKRDRNKMLEPFQEPSSRCRVLVGQFIPLSTGIDLDDKDGRFHRLALLDSDYQPIRTHQATRRFTRRDTKSAAVVRIVYGLCGKKETSILNSLSRKKEVLNNTNREHKEEGILFPGDYPMFDETNPESNVNTLTEVEVKEEEDPVEDPEPINVPNNRARRQHYGMTPSSQLGYRGHLSPTKFNHLRGSLIDF